ncbi:MAG: carboxymuconolactone decarboxylase family protein [Haloarcula sp.]
MLLDYVSTGDERARDLLAADAAEYGEPSLFARAVANNPDVLGARMEYVDALRDAGPLDDRVAELAYATVSVANDCEYCVASHTTQLVALLSAAVAANTVADTLNILPGDSPAGKTAAKTELDGS